MSLGFVSISSVLICILRDAVVTQRACTMMLIYFALFVYEIDINMYLWASSRRPRKSGHTLISRGGLDSC